MNGKLKEILEDLEYDKVFVETIDGYDNKYLNEFTDWKFTKVYSYEQNKMIDIITFFSDCAWNEQIWKSIMPIRKKCYDKYKYDIIPLDYDMYGIYDFYENETKTYIDKKYKDKIRHNFNKVGIKCKYIIYTKRGILPLINNEIYKRKKIILNVTCKFNTKQRYNEFYLKKYFRKKRLHFECWTYYNLNI